MAVPGLTHAGTLAVVALEGRHHNGLHRPQDTPPRHLSVWFLSAVVYGLVYKYTYTRYVQDEAASINRVSQGRVNRAAPVTHDSLLSWGVISGV
ncbi:hypothetical protein Pmani_036109 [Petrolisthes manimaculis]|uniref:Uncharacterized protein n=1 Tax=Petrolisthes manimaculis TaxID=1843537 RepID=A0AAE1NKZ0_9EUCA|nr:hypothetical protein Pmani_036109 [Petrolisthes manimaculis]